MNPDDAIHEEMAGSAERMRERRKMLDQMMINEPIRQLDPKMPPICVAPEESVAEAIELMRQHVIGSVLVTQSEQLIGIVTERDILCKVVAAKKDPETLQVQDIMTRAPETLGLDDRIVFALNKMGVGGFRHVPLVDEDGRPVAIISVRHIVRYVVDFFSSEILNLPPEPGMDRGSTREGA